MSDVARYVAAGDGVVKADPAGPLVKWNDYARLKAENDALKLGSLLTAVDVLQFINLKAEVERLTWLQVETLNERNKAEAEVERLTNCKAEADRLKAEVERLKAELADEKSANANVEGRMNSANRGLSMRNHLLKAEVERLREAGDAMAQEIIGCYRAEGLDPADSETLPKWNAAKEGKPSV